MEYGKNYKVCVKCVTYNQALYIEDTFNGFCNQKTDFPFLCIIMDDASTDGETDVIRKYLDENFCLMDDDAHWQNETDDYVLTYAQHKVNKDCFFAVYFLKYNHFGKKGKDSYAKEWFDKSPYVAICEGDDFWTDCLKLQKQVDVLDSNPNFSMVYTAFETIDETNKKIHRPRYTRYIKRSYTGNILPELFYSNFILTLTVMLRREVLYSDLYLNSPNKYDYTLFFSAAFCGKCYFIADVTGRYRRHEGSSIYSHNDRVEKALYRTYLYFVDRFLNGKDSVKRNKCDTIRIYRNVFINLCFHGNYQYIKSILRKNVVSSVLIPEAYFFSFLKKLKWKTFGSIDR